MCKYYPGFYLFCFLTITQILIKILIGMNIFMLHPMRLIWPKIPRKTSPWVAHFYFWCYECFSHGKSSPLLTLFNNFLHILHMINFSVLAAISCVSFFLLMYEYIPNSLKFYSARRRERKKFYCELSEGKKLLSSCSPF